MARELCRQVVTVGHRKTRLKITWKHDSRWLQRLIQPTEAQRVKDRAAQLCAKTTKRMHWNDADKTSDIAVTCCVKYGYPSSAPGQEEASSPPFKTPQYTTEINLRSRERKQLNTTHVWVSCSVVIMTPTKQEVRVDPQFLTISYKLH